MMRASIVLYVCGILVGLPFAMVAQAPWASTYGGNGTDVGHAIVMDQEGDLLALGATGSFGSGASDVYLLKLGINGMPQWSRLFGGPGVEQAGGVAIGVANTVWAVGSTTSYGSGGYDGFLLRLTAEGEEEGVTFYGGGGWEMLYGLAIVDDGAYLVGTTFSGVNGDADIWVLKVDGEGEVQWTAQFGEGRSDEGRAVQATSDGGCVVSGWVTAADGNMKAVLVKYASDGSVIWDVAFDEGGSTVGMSVANTVDGGHLLGGWTDAFSEWDEMFLAKVDENGSPLWTRNIGQLDHWRGRQIVERTDGDLEVIGWSRAYGAGGSDMYLLRTDPDGYFISGRTHGGAQDDFGEGMVPLANGASVLIGSTESFGSGPRSLWVVHTDTSGMANGLVVGSYMDPVNVIEHVQPEPFSAYPNPLRAGERLYLNALAEGRLQGIVYSAVGSVVATVEVASVNEGLLLPALAPGSYLLRSVDRDGRAFQARFLVQP